MILSVSALAMLQYLTNPWALWFAAIIPIIVVLYLLKVKRRPMVVSTLMFWEQALEQKQRRALFARLRQLLSLLFHLLVFALVLTALARPVWDSIVRDGGTTVVILDNHARMQTWETPGNSRFDSALRAARAILEQATPDQPVALLTTSPQASVAVPFAGDFPAFQATLQSTQPTDAPGDLDGTIRLAKSILAGRAGVQRVIVLSDQSPATAAEVNATSSTNTSPVIEYRTIASPKGNVGFTHFSARALLNSPQTFEVYLSVQNFGSTSVDGTVEISVDGRTLDVRPLRLAAGKAQSESVTILPRNSRNARGLLTAKLIVPPEVNALALDDLGRAALPLVGLPRVLLVSNGNFFLEKLLQADASVQYEIVSPDAFSTALSATFDVFVFDGAIPEGVSLETWSRPSLFVGNAPWKGEGDSIEQPIFTDVQEGHPVLRLVNLKNVTVVKAKKLSAPPVSNTAAIRWESPLRSFEHSLLLTGERKEPQHRIAVLPFDVADSDLPLRIAFPILISNLVHWLTGHEQVIASYNTGDPVALAPDEVMQLLETGTNPSPIRAQNSVSRAGFYERRSPTGRSLAAVNALHPEEGRTDEITVNNPNVVPASMSQPINPLLRFAAGLPFWQTCALAALILFALEWRSFHRRITE